MKIVLIGADNHWHQMAGHRHHSAAPDLFGRYLATLCETMSYDLLAEELNTQAIEQQAGQGATGSVLCQLAGRIKVRHLEADPNEDEREELGIPRNSDAVRLKHGIPLSHMADDIEEADREEESIVRELYWPIRETEWLRRIQLHSPTSCLMIVGAAHIPTFSERVRSHGVTCEVACARWAG